MKKKKDEDLDCRAAPADPWRTLRDLAQPLASLGPFAPWFFGWVGGIGWSQSRALLTWSIAKSENDVPGGQFLYHHHVPGGGKLITPTCIQGVKQPRSEGILNLCFLQLCCGNRYVSFGPDCIVACHRWFFLESKVRYLPWGYEVPY